MNNSEKASIVLNYLEECDSEIVINILLSMINDEQLAHLYDKLEEEEIL